MRAKAGIGIEEGLKVYVGENPWFAAGRRTNRAPSEEGAPVRAFTLRQASNPEEER